MLEAFFHEIDLAGVIARLDLDKPGDDSTEADQPNGTSR